jgi:hypothetical protein
MKYSSDIIGNQPRDHTVSSAVSKLTVSPRLGLSTWSRIILKDVLLLQPYIHKGIWDFVLESKSNLHTKNCIISPKIVP